MTIRSHRGARARAIASALALSLMVGCSASSEPETRATEETAIAKPFTCDDGPPSVPASGAKPDAGSGEGPAPADRGVRAATSDPKATDETTAVYANLRGFQGGARETRRVLFGQQEADVSNCTTSGLTPLTGDVERLAGKAPAIVSYELSHLHKGSTSAFDAAGFRAGAGQLRTLVRANHARGALVSLVWHLRCPKGAAGASDRYAPSDCPADYKLEELLEKKADGKQGAHFQEWRALLDELAELLWSLKDDAGALIPVQIRPFHELTGDWFWWGRGNKPSSYQAAWREMVTYLRDGRGLHNVLWVYCPDKPTDDWQLKNGGDFKAYYPGDDYVDVIGFDRYDAVDGKFLAGYRADITAVGAFAAAHGKIAAVTEVGLDFSRYGLGASPRWFTEALAAPLVEVDAASFAYVSLWRNAPWEKYMPEPGDKPVAMDFSDMVKSKRVVLAGDAGNLYARPPSAAPGS